MSLSQEGLLSPQGGRRVSEGVMRRRLREALEQDIDTFVDEFLKYTKPEFVKWAYCPDCHKKVKIDYPDYKGYRQYLESVMNQVYGPPAERKQVSVTGSIGHFHELSDAELLAIAGSEDAEFLELPAGD